MFSSYVGMTRGADERGGGLKHEREALKPEMRLLKMSTKAYDKVTKSAKLKHGIGLKL